MHTFYLFNSDSLKYVSTWNLVYNIYILFINSMVLNIYEIIYSWDDIYFLLLIIYHSIPKKCTHAISFYSNSNH